MKFICWDRPDTGCVERVRPSERKRLPNEDEDAFLARMAGVLLPPGAAFVILDDADHPSREFRAAWKIENGAIGHDMPKARAIHKAREAAKGRNIPDAALNAARNINELKAL